MIVSPASEVSDISFGSNVENMSFNYNLYTLNKLSVTYLIEQNLCGIKLYQGRKEKTR
tara:strand:+ start:237 stop:410 length:174 start_codon:yes stop_codon:yes gene_type:complete